MIRNVAALLQAIQSKEIESIARSGISHAPTVGTQYEGLTSALLNRIIPAELNLEVVTGFVEGIDGTLSGQIDCMLVRGEGVPVPFVAGAYKWPIRDVLAVFEVKKTLFGEDLTDAHDQLQSVMEKFWPYLDTVKPGDGVDIAPPRYVYGQIVGEPAPVGREFDTLPFDKEQVLRLLINDHIAPLRIILGYGGYKSEHSLRDGFLNFLSRNHSRPGYAGSSLPSLIVCGANSVVKVNGQPYYFPLRDGHYLCFASSSENPILWILNLVLTKISNLYAAPEWYGRDLTIDHFSPLLWGRAENHGIRKGWVYTENVISKKDLGTVPALTTEEWRPVKITELQAVLLGLVGNDGIHRDELIRELQGIGETEHTSFEAAQDLVEKRLLGWNADKLVFLTRHCATAFTGSGEMVAADMEDNRLFEWMMREEQWRKSSSQSKPPP